MRKRKVKEDWWKLYDDKKQVGFIRYDRAFDRIVVCVPQDVRVVVTHDILRPLHVDVTITRNREILIVTPSNKVVFDAIGK